MASQGANVNGHLDRSDRALNQSQWSVENVKTVEVVKIAVRLHLNDKVYTFEEGDVEYLKDESLEAHAE